MLGDETYGQMTNFNFDCVSIYIHKKGSNTKEPELADSARGLGNGQLT